MTVKSKLFITLKSIKKSKTIIIHQKIPWDKNTEKKSIEKGKLYYKGVKKYYRKTAYD